MVIFLSFVGSIKVYLLFYRVLEKNMYWTYFGAIVLKSASIVNVIVNLEKEYVYCSFNSGGRPKSPSTSGHP